MLAAVEQQTNFAEENFLTEVLTGPQIASGVLISKQKDSRTQSTRFHSSRGRKKSAAYETLKAPPYH